MKKINYLATAFAITIAVAVSSCSKSDDVDASMLPPYATGYSQSAASAPVVPGQGFSTGDSLQNSSSCRCPGPNGTPVDTLGAN